ncbi:MAG: hypothetical protein AAGC67_05005 [Myxococcota bacterium]
MPIFSREIPYDRKRLLARAARLESGWRWRRALTLYRHVLAAEPHDPDLHARIAPLLARSRRHYEARESFRIAQAGYARTDDVERLEATHVAASRSLPADADVARARARFERSQGRPDVAMRQLVDASDRMARRRRGEAIILLREANQIESRHPAVLLRLARRLFVDGQPAEALLWLEQLEGRVAGADLIRARRLRLRIDPTFRNLWAWLRCGREGRKQPRRRPKIELA